MIHIHGTYKIQKKSNIAATFFEEKTTRLHILLLEDRYLCSRDAYGSH